MTSVRNRAVCDRVRGTSLRIRRCLTDLSQHPAYAPSQPGSRCDRLVRGRIQRLIEQDRALLAQRETERRDAVTEAVARSLLAALEWSRFLTWCVVNGPTLSSFSRIGYVIALMVGLNPRQTSQDPCSVLTPRSSDLLVRSLIPVPGLVGSFATVAGDGKPLALQSVAFLQ
jgi:hypothetical protein